MVTQHYYDVIIFTDTIVSLKRKRNNIALFYSKKDHLPNTTYALLKLQILKFKQLWGHRHKTDFTDKLSRKREYKDRRRIIVQDSNFSGTQDAEIKLDLKPLYSSYCDGITKKFHDLIYQKPYRDHTFLVYILYARIVENIGKSWVLKIEDRGKRRS